MSTPPTTDDRLDAVLAEYFQQLDRGDAVSPQTLIETHPDLADSLREFFDAASFIERLAGPTQAEQTQMQSVHDTARNSLVGETIVSSIQQAPKRAGAKDGNVPKHFGRYEIVRLLGQGAMGAVYLAYDPSLQRQIALKIPKFADESNPDMSERFLREARSAAQLRHANICPVYDVGRIDGVHYLTMAYIEGRTLAEELRAGRTFQPREIATIIRKLALALGKAHAAGVVHRDLKPGNIMLDPDGEPILMDFGLAYREETDELRLTKSGMIVGSPAYMSPEQIEGDPGKIGPASDVYSLGVVLYEMITGKLPFQGTMMSVIGQIASKEPTPVGHWRKDLADSPLERLCKKMLAKQPQQRPASMQDVAAALDYVLSGLKQEGERGRGGEGETGQSNIATSSPPPPLAPSPPLRASFEPLAPSPEPLPLKFPEAVLAQERRDRAKMFLATTFILAALVGVFGVLAGVVVYVATDQGTLEITSSVKDVQIEILSKSGTVRVIDLTTGTRVERLRSGEYTVRILNDFKNEVVLSDQGFTLKRGGKVAVTASLLVERPAGAIGEPPAPVNPPSPTLAATLPGPQPIYRLTDYANSVRAITFDPDGMHFATAGFDNTIRRRRLADGGEIKRIAADRHAPYRAAFAVDGRLVTSGLDATVRVFDLAAGHEVFQSTAHAKPVAGLAMLPGGKTSLTGSWDGALHVWNLDPAADSKVLADSAGTVWDIDVTADGKQVAVADFRGSVVLWDRTEAAFGPPIVLGKHEGGALAVAYVGGGEKLLSAGRDGAIKLWDVAERKLIREQAFSGVWVESLGVSPDGKYALVGLSAPDKVPTVDPTAGQCVLWDLQTWQAAARLHTGLPCIYAAEFSPDGQLIFTGSGQHGHAAGGAVSAWRLDDALKFAPPEPPQRKLQPVLVQTLTGHEEYVLTVALARGGKLLASGGADASIRLWDAEAGEPKGVLKLHQDDVRSIAFTEDSSRFLTASNDRRIHLWDTDRQARVSTLIGHTSSVSSVVVLPDGERAISGSDDKTLRLWDLTKGNPSLSVATFHTGRISCLALAPDGKTLASGGQDNQLIISELDGDKLVLKHRLEGHTGEIRGLAFWPDTKNGLYLFSASRDGTVRMWRADEGKHFRTNEIGIGVVYSVAISPDGTLLAVGGGDWTKGSIKVYDLATSDVLAEIREFKGFVHALAFAEDSRTLAAGSADKSVTLWRLDEATTATPGGDPTAITEVLKIDGHTEHVSSLAVTRDGKTIVSGSADSLVLARDIQPRLNRRVFSGHRRDRQVAVDASKDGSLLVSGDFDGKLRINRSGAGDVKEIDAHEGGVMSVELSPDESQILTTGCDNTARLFSAQTGELLKTFQGHTGWVCEGAFGETDWQIATTSFDRTIRLWNATTGLEVAQLDTAGQIADALCIAPDRQTVAAGMRDGSVRVFGAGGGQKPRVFAGHADRVRDVVFTPDGKHLISGSYDRTMRVWNVESGAEVAKAQHEKHIFNALAVSPDGQHVFSAGGIWKPNEETNDWTPENDYAIRMWRLPRSVWPQDASAQLGKPAVPPGPPAAITDERTLKIKSGDALSAAWTPDGRYAVASSSPNDHAVYIWEAATGSLVHRLAGHRGAVMSVSVSTDGTRVLSAALDNTVRLWDVKTGQELLRLGSVDSSAAALSPDGRQALVGSHRGKLALWDLAPKPSPKLELPGHDKWIDVIRFSKDGSRALTGGRDTFVRLWDMATGTELVCLRGHTSDIKEVAFSADESQALSAGVDGTVRLWNLQDGQQIKEIRTGRAWLYGAALLPGERHVVTAAVDGTIAAWSLADGSQVLRVAGKPSAGALGLALAPDGQQLLTAHKGSSAKIWRIAFAQLQAAAPQDQPAAPAAIPEITTAERLFTGENSSGFSIAVSKGGGQALVGHHGRGVSLWDVAKGDELRQFTGPDKAVHTVLFWPDGQHVAAASEDATIRLWNLETAEEVRQFKGHSGRVDCLALTPDGTLLLSASADYGQNRDTSIRLWNAATGEEVRRFGEVTANTRDLIFSKDGAKAYGAGVGLASIIEWDVATGQPVHRLAETPTAPISLALSPDGSLLAAGYMAGPHVNDRWNDPENSVIRLWDLATRSIVAEFKGHTGPVGDVAFTPDGRCLLSTTTSEHDAAGRFIPSGDQTVRLWDVKTRQELARYQTQERVNQLAACPDGKSFLTVGDSIRQWKLPESVWPESADNQP
jgi:WD40 repeat protein/serine/threonine protein kinase